MSQSIAYKHYLRALSRWPADKLRPGCQFQDIIRQRIDHKFLTPSSPASTTPPASNTNAAAVASGSQSISSSPAINEKAELEQVNSIYALLDDRYSKKYPLSKSFMNPASNPDHYRILIEELEKAPTRGWLERTINKWKGALRFQ